MVQYEWKIEVVGENNDIEDCYYSVSKPTKLEPNERLLLQRDTLDPIDGNVEDRLVAYVKKDGTLPEYFRDLNGVPTLTRVPNRYLTMEKKELVNKLEQQINRTPTGELRNLLTEINIFLQTSVEPLKAENCKYCTDTCRAREKKDPKVCQCEVDKRGGYTFTKDGDYCMNCGQLVEDYKKDARCPYCGSESISKGKHITECHACQSHWC